MSQRKALLVGIKYEESDADGALEGPHNSVLELKKMLIDQYGYSSKDIVIMLDMPMDLRPTHSNILKEIDVMVAGAQAGDRFFFAYSGHSSQVENRHNSEEDGKDESIITVDGKDLMDNELKAHLVDPLPVGSSLVAILDTCHSGLLDLKHHRYNRVFRPQISKVRGLAINSPMKPSASQELSHSHTRRPRDLVTTDRFWSHNHDGMNFCETESRMRTTSNNAMSGPSRFSDRIPKEVHSSPLTVDILPTISSTKLPILRCESPIAILECEGDCRNKDIETTDAADVVWVSACKDAQRAWEGPKGAPIIMELIQILRENAHPPLKDFILQFAHRMYERGLQIPERTQYKLGSRAKSFFGDIYNFQVASHAPLDMDKLFTI
ncbi:hypothetical protein PILCRDRAFT_815306 [Piloderma croceum F 1598]|uniref:Peptidase C14 caspase domain-containing protein n=1 Tax=Piloderma croceum (strain F 1598) TaxID=765440 RepID=A0A0C3G890_PILCF|nr:hypothetical protein PILCRDRAFT_815306 [Piloderma croceum F 1598]